MVCHGGEDPFSAETHSRDKDEDKEWTSYGIRKWRKRVNEHATAWQVDGCPGEDPFSDERYWHRMTNPWTRTVERKDTS